jgi:hypothetical protein
MKRRKLLARLAAGSLQNVAFRDLDDLAGGFGFKLARQSGSHRIYTHPAVTELLNPAGCERRCETVSDPTVVAAR